jgi:hypothetical protein
MGECQAGFRVKAGFWKGEEAIGLDELWVWLRGQPNSLGGIFTVRQKPRFIRDQLMASASDFNSKRGFMVRSEGGVDANNFNYLPRNIKAQGSCAMRSADQDRRFDVDPVRVGNRNAKPEHPASGRWGRHSRLPLVVVGSFRLCHLRFGARGRIC